MSTKPGELQVLLLGYFGRPMFSGPVPCFAIDANNRGAGKGLCVSVTGIICQGRSVPISPAGSDAKETRKFITSALMAGRGLVVIDNLAVGVPFGGPTWDSLLTSATWSDRVLGVNVVTQLRNETTWVVNGNNIQIKGDSTRRILHIRLETTEETPETRPAESFRHPDLEGWVRDNRPELVKAALTILRGWHVAGRPQGKATLGSFQGWADVVASVVEWLGMGDVTETQREYAARTMAGSGDAAPILQLMDAWEATFGERSVTATEVLRLLQEEDGRVERAKRSLDDEEDTAHRHAPLRDAVLALTHARSSALPSPAVLGRALGGIHRRPVGERWFDSFLDRNKVSHWGLVTVGQQLACGGERGGNAGGSPSSPPAQDPAANMLNGSFAGGAGGKPPAPPATRPANSQTDEEREESAPRSGAGGSPPAPPAVNEHSIEMAVLDAGGGSSLPPALPPHPPQNPQKGPGLAKAEPPEEIPSFDMVDPDVLDAMALV